MFTDNRVHFRLPAMSIWSIFVSFFLCCEFGMLSAVWSSASVSLQLQLSCYLHQSVCNHWLKFTGEIFCYRFHIMQRKHLSSKELHISRFLHSFCLLWEISQSWLPLIYRNQRINSLRNAFIQSEHWSLSYPRHSLWETLLRIAYRGRTAIRIREEYCWFSCIWHYAHYCFWHGDIV